MSFLFGKKSKQQPSGALPPATRDISSSSGPGQPPPVANGANVRDPEKGRAGQSQTPTPGGSVNNSLSSLQASQLSMTPPEPKALRDRADSNLQVRPLSALPLAHPLTPCCRTPTLERLAIQLNPLTPGRLVDSPLRQAILSLAMEPLSTLLPRKMAPFISWEGSWAALRSRAICG